jgi:hypothetical protein
MALHARARRRERHAAVGAGADEGGAARRSALIATAAGGNEFLVIVPNSIAAGSKLTKASFVTKDALAASDTNYVTFGLVNKQTGAGTQVLVDDAAAANSTKVTGGSALVAYTKRDLTLVTLTIGTERDVTGGHTLQFILTVGRHAGEHAAELLADPGVHLHQLIERRSTAGRGRIGGAGSWATRIGIQFASPAPDNRDWMFRDLVRTARFGSADNAADNKPPPLGRGRLAHRRLRPGGDREVPADLGGDSTSSAAPARPTRSSASRRR